MKCKSCGEKFHYCTSCDSESCCDHGFCSDQCWEESPAYNERRTLSINFYQTLSYYQKEMYWELINTVLVYDDYSYKFETWMDKEEDRKFKHVGKEKKVISNEGKPFRVKNG